MKNSIIVWLVAVALLSAARVSQAQLHSDGYIDPSFGTLCLSNGAVGFVTRALAVQTNGNILVGGNFNNVQACVNALGRLRTNGATDSTFHSPFVAGDFVNAIAVQPNGKILVGGNLRDGSSAFSVARLNASGALDNSFQRIIDGAAVVINALAVQPDNRVLVVGYDFSIPGFFYGRVVRLNTNGAVDGTFAQGVTPATTNGQYVSTVALQSGKILVGGAFTGYSSSGTLIPNRNGLMRLNADGAVDAQFNPLISNSDIRALLVQPDDKILLAGRFDEGGVTRMITRLNADGSHDSSFTSLPGIGGAVGESLALQPDGKILFGQSFGVMRLLTNGAIDTTFGPRNDAIALGTAAQDPAALARTLDGQVLVGATTVFVNNLMRRSVARLFGDVPPPPFITQQPQTQTVMAGTDVMFSVIATGAPPITFQWRKNGAKISGATNSMLLLTNVHSSDTANYNVVAANSGGTVTSAVARLMVQFQVAPLILFTNGVGAVMPNLTKGSLEIGRVYSITARPAAGNLFSNWTGSITQSAAALSFVMESNLVLIANFVPSPFIPVKGSYSGLFYDTNSPAQENAGAITLSLDDKGGFRGSVKRGTKARKFSGTFSLERTANVNISATTTAPAMALALEIETVNGIVTGSAVFDTNHASVTAFRNPFSSSKNRAPTAGSYNALFPGADDTTLAPGGDGYLSLTISTSGRVSGKGTLADGSVLNLVTATASNAQVPVYLAPYSGRGSIFGWLTASNTSGNDVSGTLWWTKPGTVGGTFYPQGFTRQIEVIGSRYVAPAPGAPVLLLTNGVVILSGGNLTNSITNSIALGGNNKITGDNRLAITISRTRGSLTGSFVDPASGRKRSLKGVALPKQNQAGGFFLGADQSGLLFIGESEQ